MAINQPFGAFIREKRIEKGVTQQALADAMEVTRAYVSSIESGRSKAPIGHKLRAIADTLMLDYSLLLSLGQKRGLTKREWPRKRKEGNAKIS